MWTHTEALLNGSQLKQQLETLPFQQACELYLSTRERQLKAKSVYEMKLNINTLTKSFGTFKFTEIDSDMIRSYQHLRQDQGVGYSGINHETSVLQQIFKKIGRWKEILPDFNPIPKDPWKPRRTLSEPERERLLRVASEHAQWLAAYCFAVISVNTTAGPREVFTLRLQDVDLFSRKFRVNPEGAKNRMRQRMLTLNEDAFPAMELAIQRARRLGSKEPWHYVFPFRHRGSKKYDPEKHQLSFKAAWLKMTEAAKLPGVIMYDLRRTAITDLLENENNSVEAVITAAGHVDREMLKHYSHLHVRVVRNTLDSLSTEARRKKAARVFQMEARAAGD